MLITNHVVQGAVIGTMARGPVSAFVLGVASHFAADSVPHWGQAEYPDFLKVAVPDGLAGLATMAWLTSRTPAAGRFIVLAGMLGACLPDADKPGTLFFGRSPFPQVVDQWHIDIQREEAHRMPQELVCIAVGLAVAAVAVRTRRS